MPPRTTSSGSSTPPLTGTAFLNEYAQRMKSLFDAAAFPLTAVAGTGNAVTASLDPPLDPGGLVNGMKFTITWAAANTGAVTLAINGGTAVPVVDADNVALGASALAAGRRSLIEFVGTAFRILSSAGGGAAGAGPAYQAFTASGTWTRPTGYDPDTVVMVELWGGGGGGGRGAGGGGGGGGGYQRFFSRISALPSSVSVTIGAGGVDATTLNTSGGAGGNTTFGALATAFGGGGGGGVASGATGGGGGGGERGAGGVGTGLNGAGGSIGGGTNLNANPDAITGNGGGGGAGQTLAGNAVYGGGGGGSHIVTAGGLSTYGGAGGNGSNGGTATAGSIPAGGGGGAGGSGTAGAGARGECRVWVLG